MKAIHKTLEELRKELEEFSSECRAMSAHASPEEFELLTLISRCANDTRERSLDLTVLVSRYLELCLSKEET